MSGAEGPAPPPLTLPYDELVLKMVAARRKSSEIGTQMSDELREHRQQQIQQLTRHRDVLIAYLEVKTGQRDWHGVSDAANDLRVLEAQIEALV